MPKIYLYLDRLFGEKEKSKLRAQKILAEHLAIPFEKVELAYHAKGKPYLKDKKCFFNISHSKDFWALALCESNEIGVDLEFIQARKQMENIARRWMGPAIYAHFSQLEEERLRLEFFFHFWTTREALLKCQGESVWSDTALGFDTSSSATFTAAQTSFIHPAIDSRYSICVAVQKLDLEPESIDLQILEI